MGYLIKAGLGLALFFGGVVLFNVKLQSLLDTGTCASGNVPYEIAPGYECPDGTGTDILLTIASVWIGLIGAAVFAFRGDPPWGSRRRSVGMFGLGTIAWGIFFAGTGAALLIGQPYGESVNEAGEVDELRWLTRREASKLLTYDHDRELVGRAMRGDFVRRRLRRWRR